MIRNKKMFSLLIALFMVISIASPMLAEATNSVPKGSLTIHKSYFPNQSGNTIPGTGEVQTPPEGTVPLEGAEFSVWQVADEAELIGFVPPTGTAYKKVTTNSDGLAVFSDLPYGRYYVVETGLPKGVTQASAAFMVDIPTTKIGGEELLDHVHVYPKNVLTLAKAQMKKIKDNDGPLAGAVFSLYKKGNPEKLIASGLTTGTTGLTPIVEDLDVGEYYFVETAAPAGYLKDTTKQEFTIEAGKNHHNMMFLKTLKNSEKPGTPEKTVDKEDAGIGDKVTWTINTQLPSNIKTYTEYKITDLLDQALNYDNSLVIKQGSKTLVLGTDYTVSAPAVGSNGTLVINFVPAKLEEGELVITFDTIINEKAVAGEDIENKAILDYNNGFEVGKETTPPAHVKVGGHQFKKVDKKLNKVLEGAEFIVKRNSDGKYLVKDTLGMITWGSEGQATKFVSDPNGLINVNGVAFGQYQLIETKAPDGYSKLINPVPFTVGENTHTTILEVVNKTKPGMPQTGGMGTLAFTAIGLAFMGIAAKTYKKEEK